VAAMDLVVAAKFVRHCHQAGKAFVDKTRQRSRFLSLGISDETTLETDDGGFEHVLTVELSRSVRLNAH
jgi:hypothetical protein